MPSFDIVSEVDLHQATNAVDQANRVVANRFDFKGVDAKFERDERVITIQAEAVFQVQQMLDILQSALMKCDIDIACMELADPVESGKTCKQTITLKHGIDSDNCDCVYQTAKPRFTAAIYQL